MIDAKPDDEISHYGFRIIEIRTRVGENGDMTVTIKATNGSRIISVTSTAEYISDAMSSAISSLESTLERMYRSS